MVVGSFPKAATITRLVGALLLERHDETAVRRARRMTRESIGQTNDAEAVSVANATGSPTIGLCRI
jgi:hypothetical protein